MLAIEAQHLHRTFRTARTFMRTGPEIVAVEDVSLEIEPGIVYGLLGHNGAGKTTTIKMLSTLLVPTSGSARICGYDVVKQEREVRRRLGVLLGGDRGLYGKLTARDNLEYFGHLYGMPGRDIPPRASEMLELVDLAGRSDHRVEGFSRGMKQRLHLAKALMHDPPVLFLDEPTIGLDPAAAVMLRQIVSDLVPEHTVLLTTHYLHEADELCDRIGIIDQGKIIVEDTPEQIKKRVGGEQRHLLSVAGDVNGEVTAALQALPSINHATSAPNGDNLTMITLLAPEDVAVIDDALRLLQGQGMQILRVQSADLTLEDAFLSLTKENN